MQEVSAPTLSSSVAAAAEPRAAALSGCSSPHTKTGTKTARKAKVAQRLSTARHALAYQPTGAGGSLGGGVAAAAAARRGSKMAKRPDTVRGSEKVPAAVSWAAATNSQGQQTR
jgi:hypothetical protein